MKHLKLYEDWRNWEPLKRYKTESNLIVKAWLEVDEDEMDRLLVIIDYIEVPIGERFGGKGREEVNKIIQWGINNNADEVRIESERDAIPFWKRMGFTIWDQGSELSSGYLKLKDLSI